MPKFNAGQFLNVKVPGFTLRRPFGISHFDTSAKTISFCFQVRGEGTKALAKIPVGTKLDLLLPLGNGFPMDKYKKVMLVGGGIGIFPLLPTAKDTYAFLGFRNKESVVLEDDFNAVAKELTIVTDGFVTDVAKKEFNRIKPDAIFACGPHAMFKALKTLNFPCPVYVSLEERMACGFGVCICCTVNTTHGKQRVCCAGPVFLLSEVTI
jgi:dihydroorotate dehydrogenase electron transfer subunit